MTDKTILAFLSFGAAAVLAVGIMVGVNDVEPIDDAETAVASESVEQETMSGGAGRQSPLPDTTTQETPLKCVTEGGAETETETEAVEVEVAEFADFCPLPLDHDAVLREVCDQNGVPYAIAMALIYTESRFDPYAVSAAGCFGYCQLHPAYFAYCSPEDNIRAGIGWLGELLAEHGDLGAALTVYAIGHDNGSRWYASVVMERAHEWGWQG